MVSAGLLVGALLIFPTSIQAPALSSMPTRESAYVDFTEAPIAFGFGDNHLWPVVRNWYYCPAASIFTVHGGAAGASIVATTQAPADLAAAPVGNPGLCIPPWFPPEEESHTWLEIVLDPARAPGGLRACIAAQFLIPPPTGSFPPLLGGSGGIVCTTNHAVRLRGNGLIQTYNGLDTVHGFGPTIVEIIP